MSIVMTWHHSSAVMADARNIASDETMGELISSLLLYTSQKHDFLSSQNFI
jgi:hypothetical protein